MNSEPKVEYPQKYPRLWGSSLSADYPFPPQRLPTLPEDYARALEEQKFLVEQRDLDNLHNIAHNIQCEALREQIGAFRTPVPSIRKHAEKAKTLNFNQLKSGEEDAKLEIELFEKAIEIIEKQYLSAENAERVERGLSITIRRARGSESFNVRRGKGYEEFVAVIREKADVLKEVRQHYAAVSAIYGAELKSRVSQSPQVITSVVKEAKAIVKEAGKLSKAISQAAEKCKKSEISDFAAAKEFIRAEGQFKQLENQHIGIKCKLDNFILPEDVVTTMPTFPGAPETYGVATQIRDFFERKRAPGL